MNSRQNHQVISRILAGIRLLNYPVGTVLIPQKVYVDLQKLPADKQIDFSDVKINLSDTSLYRTMINNIEWTLQYMWNRNYVYEEPIDRALFPYVHRNKKRQFVLTVNSTQIFQDTVVASVTLKKLLLS